MSQAGETFQLGDDLEVHRLGYGAMRTCGPGILGEPADREEALAVLKRVLELEVNFIDTADSYGPSVSERLLYEALFPYPEDLVLATKGGLLRNRDGDWIVRGDPAHLENALLASLGRLRVDRIDLYQLHRPDDDVPIEESVGALAELRDEGYIRHIGLSNVSTEQLDRAREVVPIVSVQNRYSLVDREHEDVLQACEEAGIGFIPWFPLAAGELAQADGVVADVASRHDATTAQVALAWLLHHSPVTLPVPGTSSLAHLEENVGARSLTLSDEDLQDLERAYPVE